MTRASGQDASLVRCSGHILGGAAEEDPENTGETMSLGWPLNALGLLPRSTQVAGEREICLSLLNLLDGLLVCNNAMVGGTCQGSIYINGRTLDVPAKIIALPPPTYLVYGYCVPSSV